MKKEQEESASSEMSYAFMDLKLFAPGGLTAAQWTTFHMMLREFILKLSGEMGSIQSRGYVKHDAMRGLGWQLPYGKETTGSG